MDSLKKLEDIINQVDLEIQNYNDEEILDEIKTKRKVKSLKIKNGK